MDEGTITRDKQITRLHAQIHVQNRVLNEIIRCLSHKDPDLAKTTLRYYKRRKSEEMYKTLHTLEDLERRLRMKTHEAEAMVRESAKLNAQVQKLLLETKEFAHDGPKLRSHAQKAAELLKRNI